MFWNTNVLTLYCMQKNLFVDFLNKEYTNYILVLVNIMSLHLDRLIVYIRLNNWTIYEVRI